MNIQNKIDIQINAAHQRLFEEVHRCLNTEVELVIARERIKELEREVEELTSGVYSAEIEDDEYAPEVSE